jgi:hypothetical protein
MQKCTRNGTRQILSSRARRRATSTGLNIYAALSVCCLRWFTLHGICICLTDYPVSLPELIAQTNMDQQSVNRLREELAKFSTWLSKNAADYFVNSYETPAQDYVDKAKNWFNQASVHIDLYPQCHWCHNGNILAYQRNLRITLPPLAIPHRQGGQLYQIQRATCIRSFTNCGFSQSVDWWSPMF